MEILDPTNRWVLATAIASLANVWVAGDHDLLAVHGKASLPIPDPRAFWKMLRAGPTG